MRIGTWNVEYGTGGRNPDRLALLSSQNADIWVLTETHRDLDLSATHQPLRSEQRPSLGNEKVKEGSTWVTIWSRFQFQLLRQIAVPDSRRMVAGIFDTPLGQLAVAGVVFPWHNDVGDEPAVGRPAQWEEHRRVLRDELPILLKTMREESGGRGRVIVGDFNSHQAFPYPLSYPYPPDENLRRDLAVMLANDLFTCHTANEPYPSPLPPKLVPQTLIDHVCTDLGNAVGVETWSGIDADNCHLSDHPGVVVTLLG